MKKSSVKLSDPGTRYLLKDVLGQGVFGTVYSAVDTQASNKKVAIKVQKYDKEYRMFVEEEYDILMQLSSCMYLIDFYGIFKKDNNIWFVLENCEGNTVLDLVTGLQLKNRAMSEEHIGYILKELVKALIYLHENGIIHRDIKASNLLLTKEGEVKLCDFGLSKKLEKSSGKLCSCIGSPCWMAPELVTANGKDEEKGFYDKRVDVWALGITAIEIAEGRAPYQNMNASRVLFQIVKNPPPILQKLSNWSEEFHDFISECLVKFYEHRPYIMEIIEHPFLEFIPENNYHLTLEIKKLIDDVAKFPRKIRPTECVVIEKYIKTGIDRTLEPIVNEDIADLDSITDKSVLQLLEQRFNTMEYYTFIGDILLSINPNGRPDIYGRQFHQKYFQKSRSENAPHIYAVADTAYQDALHHQVPQTIVLTGESASGKTTNYLHLIEHLFFIGEQHPVSVDRMRNGIKLIHSLTHASTPTNLYSTRCVLKTNLFFGQTGKLTAASFKTLCLEKWRISSVDMNQSNFHILYYIYDGLVNKDIAKKYLLNAGRNYRYLRISQDNRERAPKPRDSIDENIIKYRKIFSYLIEFEFTEEQISTFYSVIAAILNLGEIRFQASVTDGGATIEEIQYANYFADLMEVDESKFSWALNNYCLVRKGEVMKKRNSCDESRSIRDVLANTLYCRFVDYMVAIVNDRLEMGKQIFGSKYSINILDLFGFECFKENHLPQFFVNTLNEQLQFHFLQRIFAWEMQDSHSEGLEFKPIHFFDNRKTLNQLLSKPEGVLSILDEACKRNLGGSYVINNLKNMDNSRIAVSNTMEFSVAHYTGVVPYNAKEMPDKNSDFLPKEIIETLKESENPIIRMLFANKLDKNGCLVVNFDRTKRGAAKKGMIDNQFCQSKDLRTSGAVFRSMCLDLLKELSVGGSSAGTHFVRCIRSDLKGKPQNFNKELVRQQIKAMSVVETALIRQEGYSQRVPFADFLKRYQFLAFDFDENVDITQENCRLLMIRLKMEGWAIGKTRVFLKHYNEEYLSRLYESQVRKIIKIQSIMRGFLAKLKMNKSARIQEKQLVEEIQKRRRSSVMTEEVAAVTIQKAYRNSVRRKSLLGAYNLLNGRDKEFIEPFFKKWKRRTIFQVLLRYRATKMYDFFNFSQQVHFYNQNVFFQLQKIQFNVELNKIDRSAQAISWLGPSKPPVVKMKFRLDEIPFVESSNLTDRRMNIEYMISDEPWDSPYQWRGKSTKLIVPDIGKSSSCSDLTSLAYNRESDELLGVLNSSDKLSKNNQNMKTSGGISYQYGPRYESNKNQFKGLESVTEKKQMFETMQPPKTLRFNDSTPANKDFDYIRNSPRKADPVAELKSIANRRESTSDDEPPFNFQGMLRKTNFQRDSLKRSTDSRRDSLKSALEAVRRFSLTKDSRRESIEEETAREVNSRSVYMELVPGLILEGVEVDL